MNQTFSSNIKLKRARRWFIIFLVMGIIGAIDLAFPSSIYDGDGIITALVGSVFGGIFAFVIKTINSLAIVWFIVAFLSRRQMKKLSAKEKKQENIQ